MEQESASEESRERAVSSEPSSTRPNPFVDSASTARKRRRTSMAGSRSRSVETLPSQPVTVAEAQAEADSAVSAVNGNDSAMRIDLPEPTAPSTPPQSGSVIDSSPAGPQSSKVTINLRTINNPDNWSDSTSPTKGGPHPGEIKVSVEESEVEMGQAPPVIGHVASSPPIAAGSEIPIEVVGGDEDDDDDVELISIQSSVPHVDINSVLAGFPYYTPETSLCDTVGRLTSFFTARK